MPTGLQALISSTCSIRLRTTFVLKNSRAKVENVPVGSLGLLLVLELYGVTRRVYVHRYVMLVVIDTQGRLRLRLAPRVLHGHCHNS